MSDHSIPPQEAASNFKAGVDESIVARFEHAWIDLDDPAIEDFLPRREGDRYVGTLCELIVIDLEFRWKKPTASDSEATLVPPAGIESYLRRFDLDSNRSLVEYLAAEEFIVRRRFGDRPSVDEFARRFPSLTERFEELDVRYPIDPRERETASAPRPRLPDISNYEIVHPLGEGGMGTVYLARQVFPVRRDVALKVIRCGTDSTEVVARFEAERQALALMDHPHIATVLDGGLTEEGLPYFAMEYVQGTAITEYCDHHRLDLEARLELFTQVCRAVQHAHQKGIIHRDLKPSNILVAEHDGKPIAKVIDFGLAKAVLDQDPLTDQNLQTQFGQIVGTPQYMSPEQSACNHRDIDTRSDVYSLGTVLYELLTGSPALDLQAIKAAAMDQVLQIIREQEPVKPSVLVSRSSHVSESRIGRLTHHKLCQQLRGDLDWIVMRTLEKDRERRYESPQSLAQDLERHRNHEPVSAGPPSTLYRARKLVRRHAVPLAIATTFLCLLVGASAAMSVLGYRAIQAEAEAVGNLNESRKQEAIAKRERAKAEHLTDRGQRQAASLSLRQAESAMDVGNYRHGLLWYLNAIRTAPDDANGVRSAALLNLHAWQGSIQPQLQNVDTGLRFMPLSDEYNKPGIAELADGRIVACLNPLRGEDVRAALTQFDLEDWETKLLAEPKPVYAVFDATTLELMFPPIEQSGDPVEHWIDGDGNRLVTLQYVESPDLDTFSPEHPISPLRSKIYAESFAPFDSVTSADFVLRTYNLSTGEPIAGPLTLRGGIRNLGSKLPLETVSVNLNHGRIFFFDPLGQKLQFYDLDTFEKIGPSYSCLTADVSHDGWRFATGLMDGTVRQYRFDKNGSINFDREIKIDRPVLHVQCSDSDVRPSRGSFLAIDDNRKVYVRTALEKPFSWSAPSTIHQIRISRNSVCLTTQSHGLREWNFLKNQSRRLMAGDPYEVSLAMAQSQRYLIGYNGDELAIWDKSDFSESPIFRFQPPTQDSNSFAAHHLALDSTETVVHAGFHDGLQHFFRIAPRSPWDRAHVSELPLSEDSGSVHRDFLSRVFAIFSTRVFAKHGLIYQMTGDKLTNVFDAITGQRLGHLGFRSANDLVVPFAIAEDGRSLLCFTESADEDQATRLVKFSMPPLRRFVSVHDLSGSTINAHPDRSAVLIAEDSSASAVVADRMIALKRSGKLVLTELTTGRQMEMATPEGFPEFPRNFMASEDGSALLVFRDFTGDTVQSFRTDNLAPLGEPISIAPSLDGRDLRQSLALNPKLTLGFDPGSASFVDLHTGKFTPARLPAGIDVFAACFDVTGTSLAATCTDGRLRIYHKPFREDPETTVLGGTGSHVANMGDDRWVVTVDSQRWVLVDRGELSEGESFLQPVLAIEVDETNRFFATIHSDHNVRLWDRLSGQRIGPVHRFRDRYEQGLFLHKSSHFAVKTPTEVRLLPVNQQNRASPSEDDLARKIGKLTGAQLDQGRIVVRSTQEGLQGPAGSQTPDPVERIIFSDGDTEPEFWLVPDVYDFDKQDTRPWPQKMETQADAPSFDTDGSDGSEVPLPPAPFLDAEA